jgi:hypothetical protein
MTKTKMGLMPLEGIDYVLIVAEVALLTALVFEWMRRS